MRNIVGAWVRRAWSVLRSLSVAFGMLKSQGQGLRSGRVIITFQSLTEPTETRTDKWLWAARVFKTRAQALAACRAGHVKIKGSAVKPGRPVRIGDVLEVRTSGPTRTIEVVSVTDRRVGAKQLATLMHDHTPPGELERARRTPLEQVLARPKGSGRPTKRELRMLERWLP